MNSRILPDFDMLVPQDLDETLELLANYQQTANIISGGSDLIVAMKMNLIPETLISISEVSGLDYIEYDASTGLRIGARATISQVLNHPKIQQYYPALIHAAEVFATPQIRNSATVVGNILRGSPAGDCSCAIMALGGNMVLQSKNGIRLVAIENFWTGYNQNACKADELAIEVAIPVASQSRSAFKRITRVNEDLAKLNAAVSIKMDGNKVQSARLAMGCVGPVTLRLTNTEATLVGKELSDETLAMVSATVNSDISPIDDKRSTSEYRKAIAGVVITRLLKQAVQQVA